MDTLTSIKNENRNVSYKEIISEIKWLVVFISIVIFALFIGAAYEEYFVEKDPISNTRYLCYTLDMEGMIGEREMLEREVERIQRQERIDNGTPTEKDIERTLESVSLHVT